MLTSARATRLLLLSILSATSTACTEEDSTTDDNSEPALESAAEASKQHDSVEKSVSQTKALLGGFIEEDPTLDLEATAAENAANMKARVEEQTNGCTDVTTTHAEGSATLTVDFGEGCQLADSLVVVSGVVEASVTAADGLITVSFALDEVSVDGTVFSGTADVSTGDLSNYSLALDATVSGVGSLVFEGQTQATAEGAFEVTISGSGEVDPVAEETTTSGTWQCKATDPAAFEVTGLHRDFSACYADAGVIELTRNYACTKPGRRGQPPSTSNLSVVTTVTFSEATKTSGEVSVAVASGTSPAVTETISLPARDCSQ